MYEALYVNGKVDENRAKSYTEKYQHKYIVKNWKGYFAVVAEDLVERRNTYVREQRKNVPSKHPIN